jgi:hypothetical protein
MFLYRNFLLVAIETYNGVMMKWSKYRNVILGLAAIWVVALGAMTWIPDTRYGNPVKVLWIDVLIIILTAQEHGQIRASIYL